MRDFLKKVKFISLILILLEIIGSVVLFLLYYYNVSNIDETLEPIILVYILLGFIILDGLFLVFIFYKIQKSRYINDLTIENLFGENIKGSFNFAKLGIAVVNEKQEIIWTNEVLNEKGINILDENILDIFPLLRGFESDDSQEIKIKYKDKSYAVSYLKKSNVYFFKDTTDYDNLHTYSIEQSIVLGLIMIDNYNDLKSDDDQSSDIMASVRMKILEYFKQYGVLLRKYSNDSYYAICNRESLMKMQDNGFEILDEVKSLEVENELTPTLSIGFAYDFPNVLKLNEMVSNAVGIAISRGGDQVVVSKYGSELAFYGGRSESVEKQNKVHVRLKADGLLSLLKNAKNVYIMGHKDTDLDAIGSCFGVLAICKRINVPAKIVYDNKLADRNTRVAITTSFTKQEASEIFITPKEAMNKITSKTMLVCCDFHRPSLAISKPLLDSIDKVLLIDHHRRSEEFLDNLIFNHHDSSASSASELVAELIKYASINPPITIPSTYATLMLAGIFLDTNFYKSPVCGIRTFEASMTLKQFGADNLRADEFLKDDYEEHLLISKIISSIKTPYLGVVYCVADDDMIIDSDTLSKAANECESMKGVNASFVIGRIEDKKVKISARSDGSINVQILCEKLGGGGHFNMAAVQFDTKDLKEVEQKLLDCLRDYLDEARAKVDNKEN